MAEQLIIAGARRDAADGATFTVIEPATGAIRAIPDSASTDLQITGYEHAASLINTYINEGLLTCFIVSVIKFNTNAARLSKNLIDNVASNVISLNISRISYLIVLNHLSTQFMTDFLSHLAEVLLEKFSLHHSSKFLEF